MAQEQKEEVKSVSPMTDLVLGFYDVRKKTMEAVRRPRTESEALRNEMSCMMFAMCCAFDAIEARIRSIEKCTPSEQPPTT